MQDIKAVFITELHLQPQWRVFPHLQVFAARGVGFSSINPASTALRCRSCVGNQRLNPSMLGMYYK